MILRVRDSTARPVADFGGEDARVYIIENAPLEALLFDRNLVGNPFRETCLQASRLFVRHIADDIRSSPSVAELVVLSKGLLYQLSAAVAAETSVNLPLNLISTTRLDVSAADATIDVAYRSFDGGGSCLLIGDTIASGATIVAALGEYSKYHELRSVYIISYAGSGRGTERIVEYCSENGIKVTVLLGLAAFGLGDNGFDLSFLHPDTRCAPVYRTRAAAQFDGKPVSAVGWDFGAQATAPEKYQALCWIEAEKWGLHGHASLALATKPNNRSQVGRESKAYADIADRLDL